MLSVAKIRSINMPPKTDFTGREFSIQEIFNEIIVDTDGDGKPDAIGVCNPDGSIIGS